LKLLPAHDEISPRAHLESRRHLAEISVERWLLLTIVAVGAVLRFSTLRLQSFDLDESVTVALLHQGFHGMLVSIPKTESTPPLYYVLAYGWTKVFGLSEVGLRSLSALFGTLMIPLAYYTTTRLSSTRAALIAAALTAGSPWLIWYSQEARAYSLFAFLALAAFACFVCALEEPKRTNLAGWAVLSSLALATHYFAVFMIAPEAAWLLMSQRARVGALSASAVVGLTGLALLPLALEQAHGIKGKAGFLQTPLSSRIAEIPTRFLLGESPPTTGKLLLAAVTGLLVAAGALMLLLSGDRVRQRQIGIALSVSAAAIVVPVILALLGHDYLDARNLIGAWAPLAIGVAAGFAIASRPGLLAAAALVTAFCFVALAGELDTSVQRTNYRGLAAALGPSPGPGQRTIVVTPEFNWTPLTFYLPGYPSIASGDVGVREIDLVGWQSATLSPQTITSLLRRGFHLTKDRVIQKLRLARFLASHPVSMSREELVASRLGPSPATVLIQAGQ
jgi:hypothetical protein